MISGKVIAHQSRIKQSLCAWRLGKFFMFILFGGNMKKWYVCKTLIKHDSSNIMASGILIGLNVTNTSDTYALKQ